MARYWIQEAIKKPGALREQLGYKKGEKIPTWVLEEIAKKEIGEFAKVDGIVKVTPLLKKRAVLALTLRRLRKR
jgi:hypothetical protein